MVPAAPAGPPQTVVVLGGGEASGEGVRDDLHDLWARQVLDQLAIETTYVNLADPGASVSDVLVTQLPDAVDLAPDTVLLWSIAADEARGTSTDAYEDDVHTLVEDFGAETELLVLVGPGDPFAGAVTAAGATPVDVADLDPRSDRDQDEIASRVLATLEELDGGG